MNEHTIPDAEQPVLFPLTAVQTEGYAKPETRDDEDTEQPGTGAEAA